MQRREVKRPIFIVSTGRSGSKMLARLLGVPPALCAFHEPLPHLNVEAYAKWSGTQDESALHNHVRSKRDRLIDQVMANKLTYVESSHYSSHLIAELYFLYDARFIHLCRDGRNFVRSGLERSWYEGFSLRSREHSPMALLKAYIRRRFMIDIGYSFTDHRLRPPRRYKSRFEKIAWLWVEINQVILHSLQQLPHEASMRVRLEDLDRSCLTALCEFIGMEPRADLLDEMMRVAGRRPNKTEERTIPAPVDWTEEKKQKFRRIAGKMMKELGYDHSSH